MGGRLIGDLASFCSGHCFFLLLLLLLHQIPVLASIYGVGWLPNLQCQIEYHRSVELYK